MPNRTEDEDRFSFWLADYYDVTASLSNVSHPGELEIDGDLGTGPPPRIAFLAPGPYGLQVRQSPGVVGPHPFNCYDLQLSGTLATLAPDVFDDGDAATPPPGGWATPRNDHLLHRTRLSLAPDPADPPAEELAMRWPGGDCGDGLPLLLARRARRAEGDAPDAGRRARFRDLEGRVRTMQLSIDKIRDLAFDRVGECGPPR